MEINYKKKHLWYVLLFAVVLVSLTINLSVSLPEKLVFGDEGYYAARGQYIAENMEIPKYQELYSESKIFKTFFIRVPMVFLSLSSFYMIAGKMGMRAFVPLVSVISALLLFLLTEKIHSTRAGVLAATFYLIMPALITHTIFLYTEHLALMFLIASFYFLYNYFSDEKRKHLIASGLFLGFSVLTEAGALIGLLIYVFIFFIYKTDWEGWFKEVSTIFILILLVVSPWMLVHNYSQTGNPGFKIDRVLNEIPGVEINAEGTIMKKNYTELDTQGLKKPQEVGKGTGNPLHQYGLISYIQFAYTLPVFLLALLGFSFYFTDRKKKYWLVIFWAFLVFSSSYYLMHGSRVEDLSRNSLFVIAPLAMAAGFSTGKIYEYLKSFETVGKIFAVLFLIILLSWSFSSAYTKAESLRPVKHFSDAFYKGCDWIRGNTPQDALIYTLWEHRAEYHCKRNAVSNGNPGIGDAIVSANNSTYKIFKEHGIDYLYLQKFSIKRGRKRVSYPLSFVQYIIQSPNYKQVYSYPQNCLYKQKSKDCVIVYKLMENKNQTEQVDMSNLISQANTNLQEGD